MNEQIIKANEKRVTLREIAGITGAAYRTVAAYAQRAGWTQNGVETLLDEKQTTIIIEAMKAAHPGNEPGQHLASDLQGIETGQSRALRIAKLNAEIQRELEAEISELRAENEKLLPKGIFADAVAASNTDILIGELAKILKGNGIDIGEKRLFDWLRNNGYLIRRNGTDHNAPTQRSMELGLFRVKETAVTHSDGHVTINKTTKVTGKGQQYFINLFITELKAA
jgi:phage antirepressor YoqD-like protein